MEMLIVSLYIVLIYIFMLTPSTINSTSIIVGETYLHRIGRTGRFGKHGLAINLVDGPKSMSVLKEIERHFGKDISKLDAEVGHLSLWDLKDITHVLSFRMLMRLRS